MEYQRPKTIEQMFDTIVQCITDTRQSSSDTTTNETEQPISVMGDNSQEAADDYDRDEDIDESQTRSLNIKDQQDLRKAYEARNPKTMGDRIEDQSISSTAPEQCFSEQCQPKEKISSLQEEFAVPLVGIGLTTMQRKAPYDILNEEQSVVYESNRQHQNVTGSPQTSNRIGRTSRRHPERGRFMKSVSLSLDRAKNAAMSFIRKVRSRSLSPRDTRASMSNFLDGGKTLLTKSKNALLGLACLASDETLEDFDISEKDGTSVGYNDMEISSIKSSALQLHIGEHTDEEDTMSQKLSIASGKFVTAGKLAGEDKEESQEKTERKVSALSVSTLVGFFEMMDQSRGSMTDGGTLHKCSQAQKQTGINASSIVSLPENTDMVSERQSASESMSTITKLQSMSLREYLFPCSEESDEEMKFSLNEARMSMNQDFEICDPHSRDSGKVMVSDKMVPQAASCNETQFLADVTQQAKLETEFSENMPSPICEKRLQTDHMSVLLSSSKIPPQQTNLLLVNSQNTKNKKLEESKSDPQPRKRSPKQLPVNESDVIWINIEKTISEQNLKDFESKAFLKLKVISKADDDYIKAAAIHANANKVGSDDTEHSMQGQTSPLRKTDADSDHFNSAPPPNSPNSGFLFEGKRVGTTISLFETRSALSHTETLEAEANSINYELTSSHSAHAQLISADCWRKAEEISQDFKYEDPKENKETIDPICCCTETDVGTSIGKVSQFLINENHPQLQEKNSSMNIALKKECDTAVESDKLSIKEWSDERARDVTETSYSVDNERNVTDKEKVKESINDIRHVPLSLMSSEEGSSQRGYFDASDDYKNIHSPEQGCIAQQMHLQMLQNGSNHESELNVLKRCENFATNMYGTKQECDGDKTINPEEECLQKLSDGSIIEAQPNISIRRTQLLGERSTKRVPNVLVFSKIPEETEVNEFLDLPSPPSSSPDSSSSTVEMTRKQFAICEDFPNLTETCKDESECETLSAIGNAPFSATSHSKGQGFDSVLFSQTKSSTDQEGSDYLSSEKDDSQIAVQDRCLDITQAIQTAHSDHQAMLDDRGEYVKLCLHSIVAESSKTGSKFIWRDKALQQFPGRKNAEDNFENLLQSGHESMDDGAGVLQHKYSWEKASKDGAKAESESALISCEAVTEVGLGESTNDMDPQGISNSDEASDVEFSSVKLVEADVNVRIDKCYKTCNPSSSNICKSASNDEIRQTKSFTNLTERGRSDSPNSFAGETDSKVKIKGKYLKSNSPRCIRWNLQSLRDEPTSHLTSISFVDDEISSSDQSNSCIANKAEKGWQYKTSLPLKTVSLCLKNCTESVNEKNTNIEFLDNAKITDLVKDELGFDVEDTCEGPATSTDHSTPSCINKAVGITPLKIPLSSAYRTVTKSLVPNTLNVYSSVYHGQQQLARFLPANNGFVETSQREYFVPENSASNEPGKRTISEIKNGQLAYLTHSQALRNKTKTFDCNCTSNSKVHDYLINNSETSFRRPVSLLGFNNQTISRSTHEIQKPIVKATCTLNQAPKGKSLMQRRILREENLFLSGKSKTLPVVQNNSDILREKIEASCRKINQTINFVDRARRRLDQCEALIDKSMSTLRKSAEVSEKCRHHLEVVNRLIARDDVIKGRPEI